MKINCEIIRDLLPLYEDEVCSEESRKAVEEHLQKCEECRALSGMKLDVSGEHMEDNERGEEAVRKGLKKIRLRWALSIVAVILTISILLLSVNQVRGRGICFTNMDDILTAERFVKAIERGEYEKAADLIECRGLYYDVRDVLSWELDEYTTKYRTIEIDGRKWVVSESVYEEYIEDQDQRYIWEFMVIELNIPVVPREELEKVVENNPELAEYNGGDLIAFNGVRYDFVKTQWGEYCVNDHSYINEKSQAIELFGDLYLADEMLYEEVKPILLMKAEDSYNYNQKYYGEARDMTLSEFEEFIRTDYENGLRSFAENGFALENIKQKDSIYSEMDRCWVISFDALITRGEKTYEASFSVRVRKGKIKVEDIMVITDNDYVENSFHNALYLDYPGAI